MKVIEHVKDKDYLVELLVNNTLMLFASIDFLQMAGGAFWDFT